MSLFFDVFFRFLHLGCTSFGGPAAHIGYFHKEFVEKRRWLSQQEYGQLVALSQVMPGPGSSQVGFAIGYSRAGLSTAIAAFLGFTLPSFLLMAGFAIFSNTLTEWAFFPYWLHSLKLLSIVIVAEACWSMGKSFCTTPLLVALTVVSFLFLLIWPYAWGNLTLLLLAGCIGYAFLGTTPSSQIMTLQARWGKRCAAIFLMGFIFSLSTEPTSLTGVFFTFFQSGSLVFGGGHVVLPLLQQTLMTQTSTDSLMLGYAAAQAIPGPMFTFASYLGAELVSEQGWELQGLHAIVATIGIFLPGLLLMLFAMQYWQRWACNARIQGAIRALNASVVGLLLCTLYQPLITTSLVGIADLVLVLFGWLLIRTGKVSIFMAILYFSFSAMVRFMIST